MKCPHPHCNKEIDYVVTASYYYQRQVLDGQKLTENYEDLNDAIGDTMFRLCPECDEEIEFDNDGNLVKG